MGWHHAAMITLDTLSLPADLIWHDEYSFRSVLQSVRRTLDGGVVVFHSPAAAGQEITLQSTEQSGWVRKSVVDALRALADIPGQVMTLTLRGRAYTVVFRHHDANPLDAAPIFHSANPHADDFFQVTLRFMTI